MGEGSDTKVILYILMCLCLCAIDVQNERIPFAFFKFDLITFPCLRKDVTEGKCVLIRSK